MFEMFVLVFVMSASAAGDNVSSQIFGTEAECRNAEAAAVQAFGAGALAGWKACTRVFLERSYQHRLVVTGAVRLRSGGSGKAIPFGFERGPFGDRTTCLAEAANYALDPAVGEADPAAPDHPYVWLGEPRVTCEPVASPAHPTLSAARAD